MPPAINQLASRLTPRGWLLLGGGAAVAILFLYIFVHTVSAPSYTTLAAGLDPAQTGKMTGALSARGIGYQLQNNGTALAVQSNQTAQARIALAGAGLLGQTQPDFSLFEKQSLGESNFQQQVTYQRALQGQLDETIDAIQGVSGAQVELVLPSSQSRLFGESQSSSAAVLLSGTSSLDEGSVRGIAQLVASSVPGLQLNKVTITDSSGRLLWPAASAGGAGAGGGTPGLQEAEQRYDQSMAASLNAVLDQIVGTGKAQVLVYANMNVNQTTQESLTYGKKGIPQQQSKEVETLAGGGAGAAGAANVPGAAQAGGKSNYKRETTDSSLALDKTVTHSTIAPGAVENQHVSVLLDHSVPATALPAIREAVTNAAGIQSKRGDTISIGQLAFAKQPEAAATAGGGMLGYAKYALVGLGALVFLFFTTRHLRKRESEAIDEQPRWLRDLQTPVRLSDLDPSVVANGNGNGASGNGRPPAVGATPDEDGGEFRVRRQVERLAESDPDRVAEQLRGWIREG